MKEEDYNWFSKWEDELPSPEELMPLSQSLITANLALAFNIPNPHASPPPHSSHPNSSAESDEPARTLKRPRLVWTPQLHKRFVDAVSHLGIKNAVPKTIMQLMSVDGLTRDNVASHLQKYRLYLKRMQGISSNGHNSPVDAATDHFFASSPVPAHFLHPGLANSDHFLPFLHPHLQQLRQFEHPFMRQQGQGMGVPAYVEDLESAAVANGRKPLALFPTGDD